MFENLQDRLDRALKTLKGQGNITEINVAATLKEIRRALVDADVNYKIAKEFTGKVKEKALGEKVLTAVSPGQLLTKIVQDELTALMGGETTPMNLTGNPIVVLVSGLQGSGKTTFCAKLANMLRTKKSKKPLLVACDVYRPAAIEQLKILAEQIKVEAYAEPENKNPISIAENAIEYAKKNKNNLVIVDTAGRLAVDEQMMQEIAAIKETIQPQETLFVVDAMTGQDAVNTAKTFNERLNFDGVVLTKLDGDTRGGAALSIKYIVNKPIKFISFGEKMETIDAFYPDRMSQRILGMGDITSFVEKAQAQYDEKQAQKLQKKIRGNQFDFNDFLAQINQIRKMGDLKDLVNMIPGMNKALKDVDIDENAFKKVEAIILSMTQEERKNPKMMNASRRRRIATGSGNSLQEINQFMKQFNDMKKNLKMLSKLSSAGRAFKGMSFGKK